MGTSRAFIPLRLRQAARLKAALRCDVTVKLCSRRTAQIKPRICPKFRSLHLFGSAFMRQVGEQECISVLVHLLGERF